MNKGHKKKEDEIGKAYVSKVLKGVTFLSLTDLKIYLVKMSLF